MKKTNYHTHTKRCMHACGSDEEYVLAALQNGYETLGFSDHTPWNYKTDFVAHMRMRLDQAQGYLDSVAALKEKYQGKIEILCGFECEYFPGYMDWLLDYLIEHEVDYIIFGHHYYRTDENRSGRSHLFRRDTRSCVAAAVCGRCGERDENRHVFVFLPPGTVHARNQACG